MIKYRFLIIAYLLAHVTIAGNSQIEKIDCMKYYSRIDSMSQDLLVNWTESPPKIEGGIEAIKKLLVYPETGKQNLIEGRVFVRFIIDEEGGLNCLELVSGIRDDFNNEALRVVSLLKMKPAIQNGRPVISHMYLPIIFKIEKGKK